MHKTYSWFKKDYKANIFVTTQKIKKQTRRSPVPAEVPAPHCPGQNSAPLPRGNDSLTFCSLLPCFPLWFYHLCMHPKQY